MVGGPASVGGAVRLVVARIGGRGVDRVRRVLRGHVERNRHPGRAVIRYAGVLGNILKPAVAVVPVQPIFTTRIALTAPVGAALPGIDVLS